MKNLLKSLAQACAGAVFCGALSAGEGAVRAINELGLELLARGEGGNAVLSPYSIQTALAMTYAGASGVTRAEMAKVLRFPDDEAALHREMSGLTVKLEELVRMTEEAAKEAKKWGEGREPVSLAVANRLFGQRKYEFRAAFLALTKETYRAPLQPVNFGEPVKATKEINDWVEEQTRKRIANLIPPKAITADTRLVLVNAIYLKAPWLTPFQENATKKEQFAVKGGEATDVPTMNLTEFIGYERKKGYSALTIPYIGAGLQLLILLPEDAKGLEAVEKALSAQALEACAKLPTARVSLHLPKFKIEPATTRLGDALQALGMKTAFDKPEGSADFDRIAPRTKDEYLFISQVFHKAFIAVDEKGTEAAAATAVVMNKPMGMAPSFQSVEVRVDRPFLFAIQHRDSGACLFLGRVVDPR